MSVLNGTLHKRTRLSGEGKKVSNPFLSPCPLCGHAIEINGSRVAKIKVGFGSRWIEEKNPTPTRRVDGAVEDEFIMKKVYFPRTITVRICGSQNCQTHPNVASLVWEDTRNRTIATDGTETYAPRGNPDTKERPIDPSWMTSRGKKL